MKENFLEGDATIMDLLIKLVVGIFAVSLIISLIVTIWIPLVLCIAAFVGVKVFIKQRKKNRALEIEQAANQQALEAKETIEYKMESLLAMANYDVNNITQRTAYKQKPQLNLLDQWFKYIDLRAKLHLNNTSTSREEAVLHLMCDELSNRIKYAEIEITEPIKREFIEENLTPLLMDIIEIMEGIRPTNSISIDAYQLLNKSKGQEETILEQLAR